MSILKKIIKVPNSKVKVVVISFVVGFLTAFGIMAATLYYIFNLLGGSIK